MVRGFITPAASPGPGCVLQPKVTVLLREPALHRDSALQDSSNCSSPSPLGLEGNDATATTFPKPQVGFSRFRFTLCI